MYYVYLYLKEDGTPYYVGKGKGNRWKQKSHSVKVPPPDRVIFYIKDVDEETSLKEEVNLISKYGRLNNGTGILENKTDGGDKPPKQYKHSYKPYERTPEIKEKNSKSAHRNGNPKKQTQEQIERKKEYMKKVWVEGKRKKLSRDSNGRFLKSNES
jgi:hypothetical protein